MYAHQDIPRGRCFPPSDILRNILYFEWPFIFSRLAKFDRHWLVTSGASLRPYWVPIVSSSASSLTSLCNSRATVGKRRASSKPLSMTKAFHIDVGQHVYREAPNAGKATKQTPTRNKDQVSNGRRLCNQRGVAVQYLLYISHVDAMNQGTTTRPHFAVWGRFS